MANVEIKTSDPALAAGIAEGVNAVALRDLQERYGKLKERCDKLQARYGVRLYGDDRRWARTKRKLARKYKVKPVGRVKAVWLGLVGLGVIGFEKLDGYVMRGK